MLPIVPTRMTRSLAKRCCSQRGYVEFNRSSGVKIANVPTPQALWEGQARLDWQLGKKNTLVTSFSFNVNTLQNVGVGGTMLAETGYGSNPYEHILRFSDLTTISAHLVHEPDSHYVGMGRTTHLLRKPLRSMWLEALLQEVQRSERSNYMNLM